MKLDDFDYELPEDRIAAHPAEPRDHSRLLVASRSGDGVEHRRFFQIEDYLRAGDCLVLNETKVLPARLHGDGEDGRRYEILLLERKDALLWSCLARPGKKIKGRLRVAFPEGVSIVVEKSESGEMSAAFEGVAIGNFLEWLEKHGKPPLPPYIKREAEAADVAHYQTVFAKHPGSVAAPTAGLHFTDELLRRLADKGVVIAKITLHVGYGTFSPIRHDDVEKHEMHEEAYFIPEQTRVAVKSAKAAGGRVFAVGTTALRALESSRRFGESGRTNLFITPGYDFSSIDGLVTNFHLPKSTLYILVSALLGLEKTRRLYDEAIRRQYRFFSFGDAMLILP